MVSRTRICIGVLSVALLLGIALVSTVLLLKGNPGPARGGCETLEELKAKITKAVTQKDGTALFDLYYLKDSPNEVSEVMRGILIAFVGQPALELKAVTIHKYNAYQPDMELPGEYEGKPLEWVFRPSHWVVVQTETPAAQRQSSYTTVKIDLPVGRQEGRWYVVGGRYK